MINRTDLIIINLNQSYSSSEIKLKKDENTRWVYFSLILLALLGNNKNSKITKRAETAKNSNDALLFSLFLLFLFSMYR